MSPLIIRLRRAEAGFTLVELLVVVVVLGILVLIAVPSFSQSSEQSSDTAATANIRSAISDLISYSFSNNNQVPPNGAYGGAIWNASNYTLTSTVGNRTCTGDVSNQGQVFSVYNVSCVNSP